MTTEHADEVEVRDARQRESRLSPEAEARVVEQLDSVASFAPDAVRGALDEEVLAAEHDRHANDGTVIQQPADTAGGVEGIDTIEGLESAARTALAPRVISESAQMRQIAHVETRIRESLVDALHGSWPREDLYLYHRYRLLVGTDDDRPEDAAATIVREHDGAVFDVAVEVTVTRRPPDPT